MVVFGKLRYLFGLSTASVLMNVAGGQMISLPRMAFHWTCSIEWWSYEQCRIHRKKCSRFGFVSCIDTTFSHIA